ncbi:hypothetical protein SDC9_189960 [bioreactor metagenome]|uniref:GrdX protein n=1 Tax=bioreactor metagenome TaxID=1076179 RepID=A0A645I4J5_9ZZZZ
MNTRCITNNPLVIKKGLPNIEPVDGNILSVLLAVESEILKGFKLLSHPMSSSIRPDIGPYKTILLSADAGDVDPESMHIIYSSIEYTENLLKNNTGAHWSKESLEDFQFIDLDIIQNFI